MVRLASSAAIKHLKMKLCWRFFRSLSLLEVPSRAACLMMDGCLWKDDQRCFEDERNLEMVEDDESCLLSIARKLQREDG